MKKGTLVILSVAAFAGMASLANATPTGVIIRRTQCESDRTGARE